MISLEELVPSNHMYRKFSSLWNFTIAQQHLAAVEKANNYKGYGIVRLFKCLLLQVLEDLSDRELARYLSENNAAKWFCGFGLTEITPEYTPSALLLNGYQHKRVFITSRKRVRYCVVSSKSICRTHGSTLF